MEGRLWLRLDQMHDRARGQEMHALAHGCECLAGRCFLECLVQWV